MLQATKGGANADSFELTDLGRGATGGIAEEEMIAKRQAVMNIAPFRIFLEAHDGKRVPAPTAMKAFLVAKAAVPDSRAEECVEKILENARDIGLIRNIKGADYIELAGSFNSSSPANNNPNIDTESDDNGEVDFQGDFTPIETVNSIGASAAGNGHKPDSASMGAPAKKVFIAHGKNRKPLEQLKAILDKFGVKYAIAVDEPHAGRPISAKVASLMKDECSSAIFIFTADEFFIREDKEDIRTEIWRPSENVIFELGAASILYDRRIVIFKEKGVTFPSDYSDLGHISFEAESLNTQIGDLFSELVALDILEVRAKG